MKTALIFSASLAGLLLAAQTKADTAVTSGWQIELKVVQQASNVDSAGLTRDEAILAAVVDATRNGLKIETKTVQATESAPVGANLDAAGTQAAYSAMVALYPSSGPTLDAWLAHSLAEVNDSASAIAAGRKWGEHVAQVILAEPGGAMFPRSYTFPAVTKAPAASASAASTTAAAAPAGATAPVSAPDVQALPSAERGPIGPGRYQFSVLAGRFGQKGNVDAIGTAARFDSLTGIAVDAAGNTYVSEHDLNTIRKISSAGVVTTFAGTAGQAGSQDGAGAAARFSRPSGLAVDGGGNVYVADTGNQVIRKIDPAGNVTTLAGKAGQAATTDGTRESGRLYNPTYLAVDAAGNVFVTEYKAYAPIAQNPVRRIAADGTVSSLAVSSLNFYYFNPGQIRVDPAGNVYVLYYQSGPMEDLADVLKLTPTSEDGKYTPSVIAMSLDANFGELSALSMDAAGRLFVMSGFVESQLHVYTPESGWTELYPAKTPDNYWMQQFAVGQADTLYFFQNYYTPAGASGGEVGIAVFDPNAVGPVITEQPFPNYGATSTGYPAPGTAVSFRVGAVGGPGLRYQWYFNSNPINGATSATWLINSVQKSDEGIYFVVVADNDGTVTSNHPQLVVGSNSSSTGTGTGGSTGTGTGGTGTGSTPIGTGSSGAGADSSGGGGSLDPRSSLVALLLLLARKLRRRRQKA